METILVGIDVSRDRVQVAVTDTAGQARYGHGRFPNDATGAVALVEALTLWIPPGSTGVRLGLEATGVYAGHLALFLSQASELVPYGATVYLLQPRTVHRYLAAFARRRSKTDPEDAWHIAAVLGQPAWLPHPFRITERTVALQRLTRHRRHLGQTLARMKNYGASYLFWHAHGLVATPPWSDPWGASATALLIRYPTSEAIAAAPLDDWVQCLLTAARGHRADPTVVAQAVQRAARDSYRLPATLQDPVHQILSWTVQDIRYLTGQIRTGDQRIAHESAGTTTRLRTVPGIGPVFAAGILAEIGDLGRFRSDDQLAQFAGLTWPAAQSGQLTREDRPLARTGNAYLRYSLVEAANSVRQHDPLYAAYYAKTFAASTPFAHRWALVLTARKLTRLIFALLRDDRAYNPEHHPVLPHRSA